MCVSKNMAQRSHRSNITAHILTTLQVCIARCPTARDETHPHYAVVRWTAREAFFFVRAMIWVEADMLL